MTYIEHAVTVAELAKAAKRTPAEAEAECRDLGLFIGSDWAGRPALAELDANLLVSGEAQRTRQHERAWAAYIESCRAWELARDEVVQAETDRHDVNAGSGPRLHAQAREAAFEAGRRYEQSKPPPLFEKGGTESAAIRRFTEREQEQPGLLRRAAAAIGVV